MITNRGVWLSALVCLLLCAGARTASAEVDALQDQLAEEGRAIVVEKCSRCHATGLEDASPHDKAPPFREVAELYPSENLAEALAEGIVSGHPDMPVFVFETEDIERLLAYLNALADARDGPAP